VLANTCDFCFIYLLNFHSFIFRFAINAAFQEAVVGLSAIRRLA